MSRGNCAGFMILLLALLLQGCGGLMLRSYPAGAEIYVDGRPTGRRTPAKIDLDDGPHNIEARIPGYRGQTLIASSRISVGRIVWSILLPPLAPFYAIGGYRIYEPKSLSFALGPDDGGYGAGQQQQQQMGHQGHAIQGHQAPTIIFADGKVRSVGAGESDGQTGDSKLDRLERLAALHKEGVLSDEEFRREKAKILNGR